MRTRARLAVSAAAISAALLLSGCGSDDGGKEPAGAGGDNGSDTAEPADDEDGAQDDERDDDFGDDELGEFHGFWINDAGDSEGILVITGEHVQFFAGEEGGDNGVSCMGGLGDGGAVDLLCGDAKSATPAQQKGQVKLNDESNLTFTWESGESGTYSKELNPLGE